MKMIVGTGMEGKVANANGVVQPYIAAAGDKRSTMMTVPQMPRIIFHTKQKTQNICALLNNSNKVPKLGLI